MNEIHRQGRRKSEHSELMTHHLKDSRSGHRWGGAELEESLIDPLLLLAGGVLPLACIQARLPWPLTPLALVQVCGGAAPAAACRSPEAALPSAGAPGASRTTQGQA